MGKGALASPGNVVKCFVHKQLQSNAQFFTICWRVGVAYFLLLACALRATTKKGPALF